MEGLPLPADSSQPEGDRAFSHWAAESATSGWVSVAFAEQPTKMVPAEAVLGGIEDASGGCERPKPVQIAPSRVCNEVDAVWRLQSGDRALAKSR